MGGEENETKERLTEATVALLENAPGRRMQITNLNKALFYLDLAALRDTGRPLTDNVYVAMNQGPVMDGYRENLIAGLSEAKLVRQDDNGMGKPVVLIGAVDSYRFMDDHLRGLAAKISVVVAAASAGDISDHSHKNPGWQIAFERGAKRGGAPAPINMFVAMQQIAQKDPWLREPADEQLQALLSAVDDQPGEPW
jgi:uncharacterized phage-associated protein